MSRKKILKQLTKKVKYKPKEEISQNDPYYLEKLAIRYPNSLIAILIAQKYEQKSKEIHAQLLTTMDTFAKDELRKQLADKLDMAHSFYRLSVSEGYAGAEYDASRITLTKKKWLKSKSSQHNQKRIFPIKKKIIAFMPVLVLVLILMYFLSNWINTDKETKVAKGMIRTTTVLETSVSPVIVDQDFIPVNKIRNALYQFYLQNSRFPEFLNELTAPFPQNYLSAIPSEYFSGENSVHSTYDGSGGWVYSPIKSKPEFSKQELIKSLEYIIVPNHENGCDYKCRFEPFYINIEKRNHQMKLMSGDIIISKFPVGLGINNSTPEGDFFINKRVANPNIHINEKSPYGSRGMELSNPIYAIHGTTDALSVGKDVSKGCIRMFNKDIEQLFDLTSLYTPVLITNTGTLEMNELEKSVETLPDSRLPTNDKSKTNMSNQEANTSEKPTSIPSKISQLLPSEQDPYTIYHWAS